jgi:hypothetical protein
VTEGAPVTSFFFKESSMASAQELLHAKQTLSGSLLRSSFQGGVMAMSLTHNVRRAVANAGRNVHAVGIGRKVVAGKTTTQPCVRVYVVQKIASSLLPPRDSIPPEINGIPTDVIESPPAFFLPGSRTRPRTRKPAVSAAVDAAAAAAPAPACTAKRQQQQRPIVAGISTAHRDVTAGTIAYFCRSTRHGDDPAQVFVLSNNHVFANVNQAHPGDDILQPGPADGGTSADRIAQLTRFVTLQLDGQTPNRIDAAIGQLLPDVTPRLEVCSIGRISGTTQASEQMKVRKHGRTTGYTEGNVTDVAYDALVGMDFNDPSVVALFNNQIRIERIDPFPAIGLGGDSGSLVVKQDEPKAVGLYFAGPESGVYGIANPIDAVLNDLEIQLL